MFKPKNCESQILPEQNLKPTNEQSQPNEPKIIQNKNCEVNKCTDYTTIIGAGLVAAAIYLLSGSKTIEEKKK